jgi:hypothetical protein
MAHQPQRSQGAHQGEYHGRQADQGEAEVEEKEKEQPVTLIPIMTNMLTKVEKRSSPTLFYRHLFSPLMDNF